MKFTVSADNISLNPEFNATNIYGYGIYDSNSQVFSVNYPFGYAETHFQPGSGIGWISSVNPGSYNYERHLLIFKSE